jgi:prepilin-type N-terminal cleavage/methylation domain-containing protein
MEPIYIHRGFTLIELLVVFAIIVTIMSVVFTSQSTFNKTFVLTNTAYDIALSVRDAETYGLGTRAIGSTINAGYGLHFQSGSPAAFSFFADISPAASCTTPDCKPGNYVYTAGSDSLVRTYTLGNGITLTDFCAYTTSWTCTVAHGGYSGGLSSLDIVFSRPNPNPYISVNGAYSAAFPATAACLTLSSPQGASRYVSISYAGEISPTAASCP